MTINNFPVTCLVVSGGHTQIILMKDIGKYKILGETRDDAAGECFDKAARILGLGYPGGPAIAKKAWQWKSQIKKRKSETSHKLQIKLPRPMIYQKNYDFSFSGLKTAVLYDFKKRSPKIKKSEQYLQEMSAQIQQAIIDVLIKKTIKAAKDHKSKTIIMAGGVTANDELRKQLKAQSSKAKINFLVPSKNLCTDNAVMTAITGYFNCKAKKNWKEVKANASLRIS